MQITEPSLLTTLVQLWRLLKSAATLPAAVSCDQLLSHEAFQLYISRVQSSCSTVVWSSLSETLVMLLYHNIFLSPIIEALWMCRIDELKDSPVKREHCLRGALIFLEQFYTSNEEDVKIVPAGGVGIMGDIHFVRLLPVILESGVTLADTSIVLTSRAHISKVFHPI